MTLICCAIWFHYHVWIIKMSWTSVGTEVSFVLAVELQNTDDTIPGVLNVVIITPDVAGISNCTIVWLKMTRKTLNLLCYNLRTGELCLDEGSISDQLLEDASEGHSPQWIHHLQTVMSSSTHVLNPIYWWQFIGTVDFRIYYIYYLVNWCLLSCKISKLGKYLNILKHTKQPQWRSWCTNHASSN